MLQFEYNPFPRNAKIEKNTSIDFWQVMLVLNKSLICFWFCIIQGKRKCVHQQTLEVVKDSVVLSHEMMLSLQDMEYPLSIYLSLPQLLHVSKSVFEIKGFQLLSLSNSFPRFYLGLKAIKGHFQNRGTWENITHKQTL